MGQGQATRQGNVLLPRQQATMHMLVGSSAAACPSCPAYSASGHVSQRSAAFGVSRHTLTLWRRVTTGRRAD